MGTFTMSCPKCLRLIGPGEDLFPGRTYTFQIKVMFRDYAFDTPPDTCVGQSLFQDAEVRLSYIGSSAQYGVDFLGPTKIIVPKGTVANTGYVNFNIEVLRTTPYEKSIKITPTSINRNFPLCDFVSSVVESRIDGISTVIPPEEIPEEIKDPPQTECYDFFKFDNVTWTKCDL